MVLPGLYPTGCDHKHRLLSLLKPPEGEQPSEVHGCNIKGSMKSVYLIDKYYNVNLKQLFL